MGIGVTSPTAAVADEEAPRSKRMRIAGQVWRLQQAMRAAADSGVPAAATGSGGDADEEWTDTDWETGSEAEPVELDGSAAHDEDDEWVGDDEVEVTEGFEDLEGLDESSDFEEPTGFEDVAGVEEAAEIDEDVEPDGGAELEDVADLEAAAEPEADGRDWVGGARSILDGLDKILRE
jgi:hypothetical protein